MSKYFLACFIATPSGAVPGSDSTAGPASIWYGTSRTDDDDEEHLRQFATLLIEAGDKLSFDDLGKSLPFTWLEREYYDTIDCLGDSRSEPYHALWTFNINEAVLQHATRECRRYISFAALRRRSIKLREMRLLNVLEPRFLPTGPEFRSDKCFWQPPLEADIRMRALVCSLLRDFHHQWRHILRDDYNNLTLRHLARAVIQISTLEFEVRENTGGHGRRGVHVSYLDQPSWEPFDADVVQIGLVRLVLCTDLSKGLSVVKEDFATLQTTSKGLSGTNPLKIQMLYIVLSVRHVMLCNAAQGAAFEYSAPTALFNGDDEAAPPSDIAMDYLIWATASTRLPKCVRLQRLPIEVQDQVLKHTSIGSVRAARIGCLLGIGSPFKWRDGPFKVTLEKQYYIRPSRMPVESEIWFGECKSGIVYLAR